MTGNDIKILGNLNLNTPVFRYMGFDKFAYLILEQKLWLTRCDKLGERHEGYHCPRRSLRKEMPVLTRKL